MLLPNFNRDVMCFNWRDSQRDIRENMNGPNSLYNVLLLVKRISLARKRDKVSESYEYQGVAINIPLKT